MSRYGSLITINPFDENYASNEMWGIAPWQFRKCQHSLCACKLGGTWVSAMKNIFQPGEGFTASEVSWMEERITLHTSHMVRKLYMHKTLIWKVLVHTTTFWTQYKPWTLVPTLNKKSKSWNFVTIWMNKDKKCLSIQKSKY